MAARPLPDADTPEAFDAVRRDEARLRPGVDAILERHAADVPGGGVVTRFADGSLPVYAAGAERVLKLYPPCFAHERVLEASVLAAVAGRLPVATPELVADGELAGWSYVLMSRLPGVSLAAAWPGIPAAARASLARDLGECLAALHACDASAIPALPRPDWPAFVAEQAAGCAERQRARGLGEAWVEQIPSFLASVPLAPPARAALLHTEVMREHLLVTEDARAEGGWRLSGLFDFEPAMAGAPEYELASVGVFVTSGDAALLRALLGGYGCPEAARGSALQRRLLAYALLHRYSHLRWYMERIPPAPGVSTLEALAAQWWAL